MKYFVKPPLITMEDNKYKTFSELARVNHKYKTYSHYNYLQPGIVSYIKRMHFEIALKLTQEYFNKCNVIDFGCADGAFLPSLAKYFNHVVGVDKIPVFINIASKLCNELQLSNVELVCNDALSIRDLGPKISSKKFHILFLLEIIEHIGDRGSLYESKNNFLKELFALIDKNGLMVISVPKMTGISFLIQQIGYILFGLKRESISIGNLIKASVFNNTNALEEQWDGEHLGFNHNKFEKHLTGEFNIIRKKDIFSQIIYLIGNRI
ncbi:MAG: class I SAM-dependent methyltransferase [Elusimicrobia bacterium]|nr:class I SAM-dependent methyltransferase [Elusimicrobiota bacterium]